MPLRLVDTDDLVSEDKTIPSALQYDASVGRFRLKNIVNNSAILTAAVEEGPLPDDFMEELEESIDISDITQRNYDGGSF